MWKAAYLKLQLMSSEPSVFRAVAHDYDEGTRTSGKLNKPALSGRDGTEQHPRGRGNCSEAISTVSEHMEELPSLPSPRPSGASNPPNPCLQVTWIRSFQYICPTPATTLRFGSGMYYPILSQRISSHPFSTPPPPVRPPSAEIHNPNDQNSVYHAVMETFNCGVTE